MNTATQSEIRDDVHPIATRLIDQGHVEMIATLARVDIATLTRWYDNKHLFISIDELLHIDAACHAIEFGTNNTINCED